MASEWFYTLDGEKHGPVSSKELRRLAQAGTLSRNSLLWKEGMKEWRPASEANKLFNGAVTNADAGSAKTTEAVIESASTSFQAPGFAKVAASLGTRMHSAARATALKAEQAKLMTVSLPAAYVALGKHLHSARLLTEEFPDLYQQIDSLQTKAAEASRKATEATGTNFTERAKALAQKGAELAKSKAAEVQQLAIFKRLGEAAFARGAYDAVKPHRIKDIAAIQQRIAAIDATLTTIVETSSVVSDAQPSFETDGVRPSRWKSRLKWIGGTLVALWLIGFVTGPRKDNTSDSDTKLFGVSQASSDADNGNPDFSEGYQAGLESRAMSPQERGQFLMGLEQQIASKTDPKAFRRGMARAFKEANDAANTNAASPTSDKPAASKGGKASSAYTAAAKQLGRSGLRKWGDSLEDLSDFVTTFDQVGTAVKAASIWHKTNGEDDDVVLLVELEPASPSDGSFENWIQTRLKLRAWMQKSSMLMLLMCRQAPDLATALQYGITDGRQYVKTMENGTTNWRVVWVIGSEVAELNCTGMENRTSPSSSGSGTTLTHEGLNTTCGCESYEDSRPSTIAQIKHLLCGGK